MTTYFLKNNLNSVLYTRDATLEIPAYGYAPIRDVDRENLTVLYGIERGWAEILTEEPKGDAPAKEELKIEITEPYKGMTLEELQADQLAKAKVEAVETQAVPETDTPAPKAKKVK